jgi:hypothetical protein
MKVRFMLSMLLILLDLLRDSSIKKIAASELQIQEVIGQGSQGMVKRAVYLYYMACLGVR